MRKTCFLLLLLALCAWFCPAWADTSGDFCYIVEDHCAIITAYTGDATELVVPQALCGYPVTAIRYCAFKDCTSLSRITLPDGLLDIGSNAFQNCSSLVQIDLPDSLVSIGTHAFYRCASLTQITLPESIQRLHPYSFYGCSAVRWADPLGHAARTLSDFGCSFISPDYPQLSLMAHETETGVRTFTVTDCDESAVHVTFPDGVTLIDGYAFFGCSQLTEISIPDSVTEIAYSAFEDCTSLTQVILPGSVVRIAENAFSGCREIAFIAPEGSAAQAFAESHAEDGFTWSAM